MFDFERRHLPQTIWKERRRVYWITSRGMALSLSVITFHYVSPVFSGILPLIEPSTQPQLEATSIFASTLLTFALLAVYRDIGETQSIQAKTQQSQERLLEIERRPYVEVVGYDFYSTHDKDDRIWVSNHGQGVALEFSIVTKVDFQPSDGVEPGICSKSISRLDEGSHARQDRSIPARRSEVGFSAKACIGLKIDGDHETKPIPHAFSELQRAGVERVSFQMYVWYWNILGEAGISKATLQRSINIEQLGQGNQVFYLKDMIDKSHIIKTLDNVEPFNELRAQELISDSSDVSTEPQIIQTG